MDLDMPPGSLASDARDAIAVMAQRIRFGALQHAPGTECRGVESVVIDAPSAVVCDVLAALSAATIVGDP